MNTDAIDDTVTNTTTHQDSLYDICMKLDINPCDYVLWYQLGLRFLDLGNWARAEEAFRIATKDEFLAEKSQLRLAYTKIKLGSIEEASQLICTLVQRRIESSPFPL